MLSDASRDDRRYNALDPKERAQIAFAAEFAERVLARRPQQLEALQVAANALTTLGYYEDGLKYDQQLIMLRPRDPVVCYNLACSLALTGRLEMALHRLRQAVGLGYTDAGHMVADADLAALRQDERFAEILRLAAAS